MTMHFSDIIGQDRLKDLLRDQVQKKTVGHAYLFSGEEGSGKRMIADAFSAALLCEKGSGEACLECPSCKRVLHDSHPDFHIMVPEKPNIISIKDVREQVVDQMDAGPVAGTVKVFLIENAEKMNQEAQNALLKTIEEPPAWAVILLLTSTPEALLETVRSRVASFETKPVRRDVIEDYLMKKGKVPDYIAGPAAAFSQGNIGRALLIASDTEYQDRVKKVASLMKEIGEREDYEMEPFVQEMKGEKEALPPVLDLMEIWYRDVLLYKSTGLDEDLLFQKDRQAVKKEARTISYRAIEEGLKSIQTARGRLKANVRADFVLTEMFDRMKEHL